MNILKFKRLNRLSHPGSSISENPDSGLWLPIVMSG
jgi:hypothetical protein